LSAEDEQVDGFEDWSRRGLAGGQQDREAPRAGPEIEDRQA